jgi:hypothetical protein
MLPVLLRHSKVFGREETGVDGDGSVAGGVFGVVENEGGGGRGGGGGLDGPGEVARGGDVAGSEEVDAGASGAFGESEDARFAGVAEASDGEFSELLYGSKG